MRRSRVSGCAIWAAAGRRGPAEPGAASRLLRDVAPAPLTLPPPPARRRAPVRATHALEQTISWHRPSSGARDAGDVRTVWRGSLGGRRGVHLLLRVHLLR